MYQLQRTEAFSKWLAGLRDAKGKARILARLESVRLGNLGDSKSLGGGIQVGYSLAPVIAFISRRTGRL